MDVKVEDAHEHGPENGEANEQTFNGDQDMDDDEIDFNLGGDNSNNYDNAQSHEAHGPGIKEDG